ncbi:MAG: FAD-dependent oxidoreductase, partial [Bacteriovoracaceae bacterium]
GLDSALIEDLTQLEEIQKVDDAFKVKLSDSSESMDFDCVFGALGRIPNTDKLGLENLGIEMNGKAIKVDEKSETSVKNIFAVGDVTNRMNLTPVALEEGMLVAEYLFEGNERVMKYENIATAVFTTPEVSTLGLTEQEAKDRGLDIEVFESNFRALKYTLSSLDSRTYMKMIVDKKSQKILGLHMAGDDAGEMMQGLAVAVKAGATKEHFDRTIGIHPTSAEEWTTLRTPRE